MSDHNSGAPWPIRKKQKKIVFRKECDWRTLLVVPELVYEVIQLMFVNIILYFFSQKIVPKS